MGAFVGLGGADLFGRFMLDKPSLRSVDVSCVIIDPLVSTGLNMKKRSNLISVVNHVMTRQPEH